MSPSPSFNSCDQFASLVSSSRSYFLLVWLEYFKANPGTMSFYLRGLEFYKRFDGKGGQQQGGQRGRD